MRNLVRTSTSSPIAPGPRLRSERCGAQVRLDEYALRVTPWNTGQLNLQVGKFATIVAIGRNGNLSWENPYRHRAFALRKPSPHRRHEAPASAGDFLERTSRKNTSTTRSIWGPSYATGRFGGRPAGQARLRQSRSRTFRSPRRNPGTPPKLDLSIRTVSGRIGLRPNPMWNFGFSASTGPYFRPEAKRRC